MNVLVDTSVWSLAFRRADPADHPAVRALSELVSSQHTVFLLGVVLQEILQTYAPASARRIEARLAPFPMLETNRGTHLAAAALHRRCRGKGIGATTVDCLIAAASMEHDCRLLTTDRDFERIAAVSKLRLV